jgi:hypothetical protein
MAVAADGQSIAMARSQNAHIINGKTAAHKKKRLHLCLT